MNLLPYQHIRLKEILDTAYARCRNVLVQKFGHESPHVKDIDEYKSSGNMYKDVGARLYDHFLLLCVNK